MQLVEEYEDKSKLPFIRMISLSSRPNAPVIAKDHFLLFIEKEDKESEIIGDFSCYGLSKRKSEKQKREHNQQATVPWFE